MQEGIAFAEKLGQRIAAADSLLCVGLDPDLSRMPEAMRQAEDPLLSFNRWVIELTAPYACAFKANSSFYELEGEKGWRALQRTIAMVPAGIPVILDAKRGDVGPSAEAYARATFDTLGADAVTVSPYLGSDALQPFVQRTQRGVFVLCHTSNPGAAAVQGLLCEGRPLYEQVAAMAIALNSGGNVGLVVGATYPDALRRLRCLAPDMTFLIPGIGAQGGDVQMAVQAGANTDGRGMVINVSRGILYDSHPDQAARRWRDAINAARSAPQADSAPAASAVDELILALHGAGCIQFGQFTLHSGATSPVYIDLRTLVSFPGLLAQVADALATLLRGLEYDRLAAIPYAALPIGTAVALRLNRPLLYPRRELKGYGTRRAIEGQFQPGERVVVVDDVLTTGASKLEAIAPLQSAGLLVQDIVVLVDREGGGYQQLTKGGYRVHSVLKLSQIVQSLARHERIAAEDAERVERWLRGEQS